MRTGRTVVILLKLQVSNKERKEIETNSREWVVAIYTHGSGDGC